jgi:hypothetical protein
MNGILNPLSSKYQVQYNLGDNYVKDHGVPIVYIQARYSRSNAADEGDENAVDTLKKLKLNSPNSLESQVKDISAALPCPSFPWMFN